MIFPVDLTTVYHILPFFGLSLIASCVGACCVRLGNRADFHRLNGRMNQLEERIAVTVATPRVRRMATAVVVHPEENPMPSAPVASECPYND